MKAEMDLGTDKKAFQINLDAKKYGTFAEIGAGQEVARRFFHVGGAAGTVAKTMSAYDMTFSDAIYGPADRYVSRARLQTMLDHEYNLLIERLDNKLGSVRTFFVFADTVAARSFKQHNESHGWLGVRFQEAIDGFQSLVTSGRWSANLFYDLGNARFRLGDFGKAILNYERALALEPHHPEAEANLRLARDEARALELRKDWIDRYVANATATQYSIAAAVGFWFALFAATRLFFSPRRSTGQVALIALALVVCGTSVFALSTIENGTRGSALAIVTGKDIEARLATADSAGSVLALPPGSEIKVLSERGGWIYAALPINLRGWIPAKAVEQVRLSDR